MIGIPLAATAVLAAAVVRADETTYGINAICNNDQLMRWFDNDHGLWKKGDSDYYWWNSANMLTTFADLAKANPDVLKVYGGVFDTVYNNAPRHRPFAKMATGRDGQMVKTYVPSSAKMRQKRDSGFLNDYYDDEGWWGLAWIAALDVTGNHKFLDEAIAIWYDMKAGWNKHHCGGLPWNKNGAAPVSIANELYMALGAAISNRVGLDQKNNYLGPAKDTWDWLSKSGVIGPDHLVRDGVDADSCKPNGDTFTYNQGVILGGMVELWRATGELAWIDQAEEIAMAVTQPGSKMQDKDGILADGCDQDKSCQGINDGTQFKGIFARNLKQLHAVRPLDQYKTFLERNARSIWQNDLHLDHGNCLNGVLWGGPYVAASPSSQSSALDCLNAAQAVVTQGKAFQAPAYRPNKVRADAVKEAFAFSWKGYVEHAFPHDSLQPVDNTYRDDRNGWGATAIDAWSTAILMENKDAVNKVLDYIPTIDFDRSATDVSFFETSIRYLGGMLSGYDLLDGPMAHLINGNKTRLAPVLAQAKRLADNLKVAYNTPSGININGLEFHGPGNIVAHKDPAAGIAGVTLTLEWQRLSDLTGDPEYGNLNKRAVSYFLTPYPQSNQPFPGLIGQNFDPNNGHSLDNSGGWTGGSDSHYEYLLKAFVYNKKEYEKYKERWELAATSSMRLLSSNPSSRSDLTFLAEYTGQTVKYNSQHLACFAGGNFIQGGLTLGKKEYIDFGLRLVNGCRATYQGTSTGIGPDSFSWQDIAHRQDNPPADQQGRFNQYGFWIDSGNYALRPEVVESYYYAYRATGDTKYQDWAWEAFVHVNSTCRTGSGFAALKDVTNAGRGFDNHQESYFLAEFLKYNYMIQADDADWQVKADQTNQFVFNTEAHPLRIPNNARN